MWDSCHMQRTSLSSTPKNLNLLKSDLLQHSVVPHSGLLVPQLWWMGLPAGSSGSNLNWLLCLSISVSIGQDSVSGSSSCSLPDWWLWNQHRVTRRRGEDLLCVWAAELCSFRDFVFSSTGNLSVDICFFDCLPATAAMEVAFAVLISHLLDRKNTK